MSYAVYVLKSTKTGKRYVGFTSKDVHTRLKEHNSGHNIFTSKYSPYVILYYETGYCVKCAREREKFLKSGQGRKILDKITGRSSDG